MIDKSMQDYFERISDDFITNDDGYEVFWPTNNHGYYDSFVLRAIADELDKMNQPWDDSINEYFETHNNAGFTDTFSDFSEQSSLRSYQGSL